MARYIDVDRLMKKISRMIDFCKKDNNVTGLTALFQVGDAIMDCPIADVQEVKHGRYDSLHLCSECGSAMPTDNNYDYIADNEVKFCYFCGAKMDKE